MTWDKVLTILSVGAILVSATFFIADASSTAKSAEQKAQKALDAIEDLDVIRSNLSQTIEALKETTDEIKQLSRQMILTQPPAEYNTPRRR